MNQDLERALRRADPAAGDPGLSPGEASAIRRRVVAELDDRPSAPVWATALAGAALSLLALAALLLADLPTGAPPADRSGAASPRQAGGRAPERGGGAGERVRVPRTIHFQTAGGTRIVWTLDPDFDV